MEDQTITHKAISSIETFHGNKNKFEAWKHQLKMQHKFLVKVPYK